MIYYSNPIANKAIGAVDSEINRAVKVAQTIRKRREEAQALGKAWQAYISDNFYTCTDEILAGLGEMYVADDRFRENIDRHTPGTATFMHDAIRIYCKKK